MVHRLIENKSLKMSGLKRHLEWYTQREQPLKDRTRFWTWNMRGLHGKPAKIPSQLPSNHSNQMDGLIDGLIDE